MKTSTKLVKKAQTEAQTEAQAQTEAHNPIYEREKVTLDAKVLHPKLEKNAINLQKKVKNLQEIARCDWVLVKWEDIPNKVWEKAFPETLTATQLRGEHLTYCAKRDYGFLAEGKEKVFTSEKRSNGEKGLVTKVLRTAFERKNWPLGVTFHEAN